MSKVKVTVSKSDNLQNKDVEITLKQFNKPQQLQFYKQKMKALYFNILIH